ncbi:MAG: hypothetical protein UY21_C0013G0022 [Microgenomates group bacterium GW2011_GWA1_48_10]|uniref:Prenyltransferase n=1 Tax=Candidatus Gottesmanbacteria bacterium RIFCSPHIGHO2_01_FULL_47_48 TaxID=1798381 RepID=A0A1F6A578_9BACT|nr:MAG: hypothetical protein UY21_C0013G0022 [Microgenomates group bacterium GW2011_GWA1_48_10]OGG19612.1 MAG: hypothetical protein A2721_02985 [Candidatus Gottesmanbacteria bacterium RIFCSPHIGHO2_01_FULL_47_48]
MISNLIDTLQEKAAPYIKMMRLKDQTIGMIVFTLGLLDARYFNLTAILQVFIGLLSLAIACFIINDFVDSKDADQHSYRSRIKNGEISIKIVIIIWSILTIIGSIILFTYGLFWQWAVLVFLNTFYSLPPLRFKARFFLDIFSLFLVALITYSIPFTLNHRPFLSVFNPAFLTLALFFSVGEFILLIMDFESDQKGGLKNTGVVLGYTWLIRLAKIALITSAVGFAYLAYTHQYWWYYPMIIAIPYFGYAVGRLREAVYLPENVARPTLNISFTRAITTMALITFYLLAAFVWNYLNYNKIITWPQIQSLFR